MALVKLGHEDSIKDGERIVKECWERCVVAIRQGQGSFHCFELPDSSFAEADADKLRVVTGCKTLQTYRDSDGMLWVNLPNQHKPQVDKSFKVPGEEGWGLGNAVTGADVPPPLVPFAGRDCKAMPPSPAKPFSIPASPAKPSPFKERVDAATEAVVQKNWNQRQAKMGEFFAPKKKTVATAGPVEADT
ncbi:hypothetical protein OEZ86_007003 [Tetradesmus obliquus]|nr:hypothetical protein OEZ86_007003 [Tetradesmus obliquus]